MPGANKFHKVLVPKLAATSCHPTESLQAFLQVVQLIDFNNCYIYHRNPPKKPSPNLLQQTINYIRLINSSYSFVQMNNSATESDHNGSCAATWSLKRVLSQPTSQIAWSFQAVPGTRQGHLHLPASSLMLPDTSHVRVKSWKFLKDKAQQQWLVQAEPVISLMQNVNPKKSC